MSAVLLFLVPLIPVVLAFAVLQWPALARWSALGLVPAVVTLVLLDVGSSARYEWWLFGSEMGLDQTAVVFLMFTLVLWLAAALFANGELQEEQRTRFSVFFLLTMGGNLGVILAQDAATFYLFFALMSFASYGLVVQRGDLAAQRAGLIYLIGIVIGEVALFVALVMLDAQIGGIAFDVLQQNPISHLTLILLLLGFGIKSGLLLLHVWMPLAYAAAPVAASVVLAGALVKLGLLGWLRFLPLGFDAAPGWGRLVIVLGLMAAFYGVVVGLLQRNPKVILAYSSVSQMGLMTALVGLGLVAPQQWPLLLTALLVYVVHHAIVKGTLFMGVGMLSSVTASRQRRLVMVGMVVVALAMAGGPLLSGAVAKLIYKSSADQVMGLDLLLTLSALATALLMARLIDCLRCLPRDEHNANHTPWYLLLITLLLWPWLWPIARDVMLESLTPDHLLASSWPVLVAAGSYGVFMLLRRFRLRDLDITMPPGDMLSMYETVVSWLARVTRMLLHYVAGSADSMFAMLKRLVWRMNHWLRVGRFEALLLRWEVAWGIYLGLIVVILLTEVVIHL